MHGPTKGRTTVTHTANSSLELRDLCHNCGTDITVVEFNGEFVWTHVRNGHDYWSCAVANDDPRYGDSLAQPPPMEPLAGYAQAQLGEWWCGVCKTGHPFDTACPDTGEKR